MVVSNGRARLVGPNVHPEGSNASVSVGRSDTVTAEMYVENDDGAGFSYLLRLPVQSRHGSVRVLTPYKGICRAVRTCGGEGTAYFPNETRSGVSFTTRLHGSG